MRNTQTHSIEISLNNIQLLTYLRTLNFITIGDERDGNCTISFDESEQAKELYRHLNEYLLWEKSKKSSIYFANDICENPVTNLKRIVIKEKDDEYEALTSYLKTLPFVEEIESNEKGVTVFKVNIEKQITYSLVEYLKTLYKSVDVQLSSPGDIVIELYKKTHDDQLV